MNLNSTNLFEQGLYLAHASAIAYDNNPQASPLWNAVRLTNPFPFGDVRTDTNGYVARTNGHIVVAFRGTSSLANLNTDLQIAYNEKYGGSIHRGFSAAVEAVVDEVRKGISTLSPASGDKLWITGHSLGGALALLMGKHFFYLKEKGDKSLSFMPTVVTFGAPKVGNSRFVEKCPIKKTVAQFINDNDPVPFTPPVEGWDYQPLTPHYRIFSDGYFKYQNVSRATLRREIMEKIRKYWFQLKSIILGSKHSHGIESYISNLEGLIAAKASVPGF